MPTTDVPVGSPSKKIMEMAMSSTILTLPAMPMLIEDVTLIFLEGEPTGTSVVGIFIGIAGCFWYTAYKQWEAQQAKKGMVSDSVASEKSGLVKKP